MAVYGKSHKQSMPVRLELQIYFVRLKTHGIPFHESLIVGPRAMDPFIAACTPM